MLSIPDSIWVAVISMIGGVVITVITVWGGKRATKKSDTPKNRADNVFDGYDRLIENQQLENDRLLLENNRLSSTNRRLNESNRRLTERLQDCEDEVEDRQKEVS